VVRSPGPEVTQRHETAMLRAPTAMLTPRHSTYDVLFAGDQKPNAIAVTSRTFAANIRMATASGRRISVDMAGDPPSDPGKLTIHRICSGRAGPAAMLAPGNPKRGGVQRLGPQDSTRRVGHLEGLSHRQADSRTSSKSSEALN
jgi:hypothetical protein